MDARFSVGIDLGTSNSAIAIADLETGETRIVDITQILAPNQLGGRPTLASALYVPHGEEFPKGSFPLPWNEVGEPAVVGEFARDHGALVPDRLVTSAKSWLSNPHIDLKQPILPWRSDIAEDKLSPKMLAPLFAVPQGRAPARGACRGADWDLSEGQIILTVPASFDEVARSLTAEAAKAAGLGSVTLLEEPQAAFYAWTAHARKAWRDQIAPGDLVLVCDVGGGTADFSLIAVSDIDGRVELERVSVGEHILLGGDNMDLALAFALQAKLEAEGKSLDPWQFLALVHAASKAKITLFEDSALAEAPIAVPSRGSSLFAKTVSTTLDRDTVEQVVLDGFFARTSIGDVPRESRKGGLQEFGLPYASDPAVSPPAVFRDPTARPLPPTLMPRLPSDQDGRAPSSQSCRRACPGRGARSPRLRHEKTGGPAPSARA